MAGRVPGRAVLLLALLVGVPSPAFAYVDPGILSVLYQALYVALFGAAATFIFRPWNALKSLFRKGRRGSRAPGKSDSPDGPA